MDKQKSNIYKQVLVAIIANIASAGFGLGIGWSSPNVPKLQDVTLKDTPLDRVLTAGEIGWIGSLVPIGGAISPYFAGTIAAKFGRKPTMLLCGFILLSSYIILGVGHSVGLIYTARLMHGFCVGLTMTVMPMYIGEIAQDSIRGALGVLMMIFLDIGMLFSYCVGPFVPYATFQFICLIFPISFILLFSFMPETPTYYLLNGHKESAIKSLMFLRNTTETNVLPELEIIQRTINENQVGSWTQLFTNRANLRALTISCGLMVVTQLAGINAVVSYSQTIYIRAGSDIAPAYASIISGSIPFMVSWCVPFAIERVGRRINLLASGIGAGIGSTLLCVYFFLEQHNSTVTSNLSYLPLFSLIMYTACYVSGFGPVPWAVVGEIFSPDIKAHATMIAASVCSICAAIVVQFFETLNDLVGPSWVFLIFTVCIVIGIMFIYFFVIETKGLTLLEIQEKLKAV